MNFSIVPQWQKRSRNLLEEKLGPSEKRVLALQDFSGEGYSDVQSYIVHATTGKTSVILQRHIIAACLAEHLT